MSGLAIIMGTDVPATLGTIENVGTLKRGLYNPNKLKPRPALYYFMDFLRMKGATNKRMDGSLIVGVGCWVDIPQGDYTELDRLFEAVQTAMFSQASNPNWWSKTRPAEDIPWWIYEPEDGENFGGFLQAFQIIYEHQRTAP